MQAFSQCLWRGFSMLNAYVLWPFGKKNISELVTHISTGKSRVHFMTYWVPILRLICRWNLLCSFLPIKNTFAGTGFIRSNKSIALTKLDRLINLQLFDVHSRVFNYSISPQKWGIVFSLWGTHMIMNPGYFFKFCP